MKKNNSMEETIKDKRGRKPVADKKIPITIYVKTSLVNKLGGMSAFKQTLHGLIKYFTDDGRIETLK